MPTKKLVKSFELIVSENDDFVSGRDDDISEYLAQPQISTSAACRAGLRLLIAQDEGKQDLAAMAAMVEEILTIVKSGVAIEVPPSEVYNDPFLDKGL